MPLFNKIALFPPWSYLNHLVLLQFCCDWRAGSQFTWLIIKLAWHYVINKELICSLYIKRESFASNFSDLRFTLWASDGKLPSGHVFFWLSSSLVWITLRQSRQVPLKRVILHYTRGSAAYFSKAIHVFCDKDLLTHVHDGDVILIRSI